MKRTVIDVPVLYDIVADDHHRRHRVSERGGRVRRGVGRGAGERSRSRKYDCECFSCNVWYCHRHYPFRVVCQDIIITIDTHIIFFTVLNVVSTYSDVQTLCRSTSSIENPQGVVTESRNECRVLRSVQSETCLGILLPGCMKKHILQDFFSNIFVKKYNVVVKPMCSLNRIESKEIY